MSPNLKFLLNLNNLIRETVSFLTSEMGKKTLTVLAHSFLLPERANSGYTLFM